VPHPQGFFVPCYECGQQVLVTHSTFKRVMRCETNVVCEYCLSSSTYSVHGATATLTSVACERCGASHSVRIVDFREKHGSFFLCGSCLDAGGVKGG
jgi:ssDNA-binding Zn-finger/Zn-ribbon topoisomerase 1